MKCSDLKVKPLSKVTLFIQCNTDYIPARPGFNNSCLGPVIIVRAALADDTQPLSTVPRQQVRMEDVEDAKERRSDRCCSVSKCQCLFLGLFILAMFVTIGVLAGFLVKTTKQKTCSEQEHLPGDVDPEPWTNHRLPDYIIPDHYDLTLYPDFYDGHETFYGNVTIRFNVTKATLFILVHIRDLTVTNTHMHRDGNDVGIETPTFYEENEYWVIQARQVIEPGQVEVDLQFQGSLTNGIVGLYKSTYKINDESRYLATSKFQPTDARKAFPCLDEPGFKSTFTVTLVHQPEFTALSNMDVESESERAGGLTETHFRKSVPMVTYLACFIVCEFDNRQLPAGRGKIPFRVWATPDKIDQAQYALELGVNVLGYFEELYGLDYPLPKMDMIAIPDFVSGAMEHWGLITYRETNMLYSETEASLSNKQRVAVVVAHELAHMWFGNLVTMKWWDDLWLNEGFASYVEYLGVDHHEGDWDMLDVFVSSDLQGVMPDDSKVSSHPIIVPVDHPSEITEVFDSISYSKGASVLRMLNAFMGKEKFETGLQKYMQEYQFKSTVTDDLWQSLQEVEGAPDVKAIMDTWTLQMGYPVIHVQVFGSTLKLTQERFLLDPNADKKEPPSPFNYKWRVPITYQTLGSSSGLAWLTSDSMTIDPGVNPTNDWVKINVNQEGFYRVSYDVNMWNNLINFLNTDQFDTLAPGDRSNLIDDIFTLASAGIGDLSKALDLVRYMHIEPHYVPWATLDRKLGYMDKMMVTGLHYEQWQIFIRSLTTNRLEILGYEDDNSQKHLTRQLRGIIINLACSHGDTACLGNVTAKFQDHIDNDTPINPNIRSAVYRFGMEEAGDEAAWDKMWEAYQTVAIPQEKSRLQYALTRTSVPWLISRMLEYSLDREKIRQQDFFTVIYYLGRNPSALPIVWNFARTKWEQLVDEFGIDSRYLGRMVPRIVEYFNTQNQLDEVMEFFAKYPDAGAGARGREQVLEQIHANIAWMDTNMATIVTWLSDNV